MAKENMNNEKIIEIPSSTEKTIYILDTNILLREPFTFLSFNDNQINTSSKLSSGECYV